MDSAAFDYDLPEAAIAQQPAEPRDSSRLLIDGAPVQHATTRDFPDLVGDGDVIIVNNSRVLPARLRLHKRTGGHVEVLALEPLIPPGPDGLEAWEALVRPSRRVPVGTELVDAGGDSVLIVGEPTGDGTRTVAPVGRTMADLFETHGEIPLPPYITGMLADTERYQTVYADSASSVAAPTAGLHLTTEVLERCRGRGACVLTVDLSVGVGTFRPLEAPTLEEHRMHSERYQVPTDTWAACAHAARVVAVGTTVVRALESVARSGDLSGRTELFLRPGDRFEVVDAMLTNFHMPRSTLLVMIEAFVGPRWRELYRIALDEGYRFLSFGDAMFIEGGSSGATR